LLSNGEVVAGSIPGHLFERVRNDASAILDRRANLTLDYGGDQVYLESIAPQPRLLIFGAVHIAQELVPIAQQLDFRVTVSDARPAFLTPDRFPSSNLLAGWPDQVDLDLDRATSVVILSHDPRFEDPLWPRLLSSEVPYIGAMGSKKTAAARRQRLLAAGFAEEQVDRIHGPIGLDIGADSPAEVAVAIIGEVVKSSKRAGQPLKLAGTARRLPGN
jgi:xanthine dehydrogenase accessory factor